MTVSLVENHATGGKTSLKYGLCSNWLNSIQDGEAVHCVCRIKR